MLHFICAADRLCVTERIVRTVCERAAEGVEKQILIVPEPDSHEAERALCLAGGDTISRYAEVLSFSRLASRLFSVYGGVSEEYLDEGGRLLSMVLTVRQVLPRLKFYAAAAGRVEFLRQLGQGMEEFLSYALTPEDFTRCAARVSGPFAQKLTELGLLYESYLSVCRGSRRDPVTRQLELLSLLRREDWAAEHTVYLSGFSDFTGVQMQIVSELMRTCPEMTVALTTDGSEQPVFAAATETLRRLKREAARCCVPYEQTRLTETTERNEALAFWLAHEFDNSSLQYPAPTDAVALQLSSGVRGECALAAAKLRSLLMQGCRCRELRVAVADRSLLRELRPMLRRSGIPAYFSGDIDLLQRPLPAAVLSALRAVQRFEFEPVMDYLKSGFSPLSEDACDRVQEYARFWNIQGARWTNPWTNHPNGYGKKWTEEDRQTLALLEGWRQAAIEPLSALRAALRAAVNVRAEVKALADFFENIGLRETLQTQTEQLYAAGDAQTAQQTGQLYESLIGAMSQMELILGEQTMDAEQFTELFSMLLGCCRIGTIPVSVDELQVGMLSDLRHGAVKHLIVLGAEEGLLPAFAPAVGLLRDDERRTLLSMGLSLAPCDPERLERELATVHQAFSSALESVTLCAASPQTSYLFERTRTLFPQLPVTGDAEVRFAPDPPAAAAELVRAGQAGADWVPPVLLQLTQELEKKTRYAFTPLRAETVRRLYGREISLSASKLDTFASCKYAFFLRYGLKLQPWKQAKFDAPVFGTFVHYVLECTVREVQAAGGFQALSDEQVLAVADRHIADYREKNLPDLDTGSERDRYLFTRNLSEVREVVLDVAGELRQSLFRPVRTELSFGPDKELPPVRIDCGAGTALLSGAVDRVDIYEGAEGSYYRVDDYKTGRKEFDYADLLNGEGLQMLIYLFTLRRQMPGFLPKKSRPAGVLYVPGRCEMLRLEPGEGTEVLEKKRREGRIRKGLILNEDAALHAMEPVESGWQYLPHKARTGIDAESLASGEQLEKLERFVSGLLSDELRSLLGGTVEPDPIIRGPMQSSCQFCDFAGSCHKDLCPHKNRYTSSVKAERFWEEVERRLQHG